MIEIRHTQMDASVDTMEAYNKIYSQEGIQQKDSFYKWIISLLDISPEKIFLDVSCGFGRLCYFADKISSRSYGLDFSYSALTIAYELYPKINWILGDGEFLPFSSNSIDIITNIGSLEHFQSPDNGIKEISRILKKDGKAYFFLPNGFSLLGNIKYVMINGDVFDDGQPLQRYNTVNGWMNLLESNGLITKKIVAYERPFPRTLKDALWYLTHPAKLLHLFLGAMLPRNLKNCFLYICVKNTNDT